MNLSESIRSLNVMSEALAKLANDPKNYNNPISQYLENISRQCENDANALQEMKYAYGEVV